MFLNEDATRKLSPIVEKILYQSQRVECLVKDWSGNRGAHFQVVLIFRFKKKLIFLNARLVTK